ncbi:MAG TPA: heavy metal-responsive transcriptional regulator [Anaerolineae bacterium]|nr:heavy metal-responsive transcriptional regulator [Anaerolineae bacterium]
MKQIGSVARELGVNPKTIRYYEEIGLIPPAQRTESGYRVYGQADIDRIAFILRARELDFSLDDIREILALREGGEAPCLYVTDLVQKQLAVIDAKIAALNQLREELEDVQRQAETIPLDTIVDKECVCHLIENRAIKAEIA